MLVENNTSTPFHFTHGLLIQDHKVLALVPLMIQRAVTPLRTIIKTSLDCRTIRQRSITSNPTTTNKSARPTIVPSTSHSPISAMDAASFRKAAHAAIEEIIQHNSDIANSELPVLPSIKPGYLRPLLPTSAPESPESWSTIQPDIASKIVPGLTHWQSPDFLAFFPACATYPSILGEMYSAAFTAPAFNWLCSPACTELETVVLDWLADAFHLPKSFRSDSPNGGGGVIQGSASEAIVTVMVAARERYLNRLADRAGNLEPGSFAREKWMMGRRANLVALSSDQAHSSTAKGARIAGTWHRNVETRWEDGLAVTASGLRETIRKAKEEGLEPYYITLSFGTTSTCAVDPLHELGEVLKENPDIWVHIDAAYAGTALVCPEYANVQEKNGIEEHTATTNGTSTSRPNPILEKLHELTSSATKSRATETHKNIYSQPPLPNPHGRFPQGTHVLEYADSWNTNLHKWLLVSFDASLLYVRSRNDLTSALSITPAYLQNKHTDSGLVTDYRDWQIPLGRRFRALKIWFVVRSYGLTGLRGHIRRTVKLGMGFEGLIRWSDKLFELVAQPAFGLVCFRVKEEAVRKALEGHASVEKVVGNVDGGDKEIETETTMNESPFGSNEQQTPSDTKSTPKTESLAETTNALTKAIVETINDSGTLFLTSSHTHDKTFIRVVSGNENGTEETMMRAFDRIVSVTEELLQKLGEKGGM